MLRAYGSSDATIGSGKVRNPGGGRGNGNGKGSNNPNNWTGLALGLHMDGSNGGTTFTDSSVLGHSVSANNGATTSTTQAKFGQSGKFNGTFNNVLNQSSLTVADHPAFDFADKDFTICGWFWINSKCNNSQVAHGLVNKRANTSVIGSFGIEVNQTAVSTTQTGILGYCRNTSGTNAVIQVSGDPIAINTWYHVALVRTGTQLKMYLNGVQVGATATITGSLQVNTSPISIGAASATSDYGLSGYMDDWQFYRNQALWTANFTPPTVPFTNP